MAYFVLFGLHTGLLIVLVIDCDFLFVVLILMWLFILLFGCVLVMIELLLLFVSLCIVGFVVI